jgi:hypothetical protein
MRITRIFVAALTILLVIGYLGSPLFPCTLAVAQTTTATSVALGPQYDTTHVYVAPTEFDLLSPALLPLLAVRPQRKESSL